MIQVAGRIVRHAGSVTLKLAADIKKFELFQGIRQKIYEMSMSPGG